MALKNVISKDDHEKLPDVLKAEYKEVDGKFTLDVEGLEDNTALKKALEQERENRRKAEGKATTAAQLTKKYEDLGLSPEEITTLKATLDQDEETKLLAKKDIEGLVAKRTEAMKKDFDKKVETANAERDSEKAKRVSGLAKVLQNSVRSAVAGIKDVHQTAGNDIWLNARDIFRVNDENEAVAYEADGTTVRFGKDGKTPLTIGEWLDGSREEKPHWFLATAGGSGATQSGTGGKGNGKTIKRAAFDTLSNAEKSQRMKDKFEVVD